MFKCKLKLVFASLILIGASAGSFAGGLNSSDTANNPENGYATPKNQNPSTVGSKQGSNAVFGNPAINKNGKGKGSHYQNRDNPTTQINKPTVVGANQMSSSRTFGEPKITGQKGQKYYTKEQRSLGPNKSTQTGGSKMGSNQVFGYPGSQNSNNSGQ